MTRDEVQLLLLAAEARYEDCVLEWRLLEDEYRDADRACDEAEERVEALKAQLEKFDE